MKKREIIFVSNYIGAGGAARVISILARKFTTLGYSVTICSFPGESMNYPREEGVSYVFMELHDFPKVLSKVERIYLLRKQFKKRKDAVIISFEYFMNVQTLVASFGMKNRKIISERNDPERMGGSFPMKYIRNIMYRFCDVLVCQTKSAKEYFPRYIRRKATIILNPVRDNLPECYEGSRRKVIVNFCRLEKQKNLPLLIDAFSILHAKHSDYRLEIYGDGKERRILEDYIEKQGLSSCVHIHDAVSNIHELVYDSAMFVSSSDYEGLSNSMLEAMGMGLPVICTDCPCGGAEMVIRHGKNGLLVPVGDKESMANAMLKVVEDPVLSRFISRNAGKLRQRLSTEEITAQWEKLL